MANEEEKKPLVYFSPPPYQSQTGPQIEGYGTSSKQESPYVVVTTPPTGTAHVPTSSRSDEHMVLPMIGVILSVVQLSVCMAIGNFIAAGCIIPGFVFAIIGLYGNPDKARRMGQMSIFYNILHFVLWMVYILLLAIILPIVLTVPNP